ncbi:hypothetical protein LLB_2777 [Legionella longbeachae D-4968]|nr:hypothetical protein LLB_2777 [Legionella longbeachae D-4968]
MRIGIRNNSLLQHLWVEEVCYAFLTAWYVCNFNYKLFQEFFGISKFISLIDKKSQPQIMSFFINSNSMRMY